MDTATFHDTLNVFIIFGKCRHNARVYQKKAFYRFIFMLFLILFKSAFCSVALINIIAHYIHRYQLIEKNGFSRESNLIERDKKFTATTKCTTSKWKSLIKKTLRHRELQAPTKKLPVTTKEKLRPQGQPGRRNRLPC